jgi:hypothetical protein
MKHVYSISVDTENRMENIPISTEGRVCLLQYQHKMLPLPYTWIDKEESSLYKLQNRLHGTGNDVLKI